ncbi:MAG: hypothetical protein R3230_01800 [Nitrosopumilaceae archaeon]|nr:hypothetical protein [Nitrosopumilaceae archaeon]
MANDIDDDKKDSSKNNTDVVEEEKLDKSLDEVSNVIHDLLTEPNEEDTDETIQETLSEHSEIDEVKKSETPEKFSKFKGFFKKKEKPQQEPEEQVIETSVQEEKPHEESEKIPDKVVESLLEPKEVRAQYSSDKKYTFDEFIDERILISRDAFGKKEMKIKVLEVSDEKAPTSWKLGDRVKLNKILVTVKHLESQEIEEGEFDIQSIEKELAEKRHYTSTNRWVPTTDIKNGYVVGARHTSLISDAIALDYIIF